MLKKLASSIQFKIAMPYVLLIIFIASIAGPTSNIWVTRQIEKSNELYLQEESLRFQDLIRQSANKMSLYAKLISDDEEISIMFQEKKYHNINKHLIPMMTTMKLDFAEVIDENGQVVLSINGPFPEGNNVSYLNLFRQGQLEMNSVEMLSNTSPNSIAAVNPIRSSEGVIGQIVVGQFVNDNYLSQITSELKGNIIIYYDGDPIASSLKSPLKVENVLYDKKMIDNGISFRKFKVDNRGYEVLFSPLKIDGENIGYIATIASTERVTQAKSTITKDVILLNSLIIVLMILIAFVLTKIITKPLTMLTSAARIFAKKGEDIPKVKVRGSDEVADLARTFNKMTSSIVNYTKELKSRVAEFTALYEMTKNLGASLDMQAVMQNVVTTVLATLNADSASIMLLDPETNTLEIAFSIGLDEREIRKVKVHIGERIAGWVAEKGKPMLISDVISDRYLFTGNKENKQISAICVPLIAHKEILGVLNVSKEAENKVFTQDDLQLLTTIGGQAAIALKNAILFKEIENLYLRTVKALAKAIEAKDPYTRGHSERVAELAVWIAREMGLSDEEVRGIETAAYLHDIGKIGIEDKILLKPSKLDSKERDHIERHPDISYSILKPINFPWDIATIVRHHHEFFNGQGYVDGKKGEEIPLGSRILTVADAFEAMTSERPYRKAKSSKEALKELDSCSGTQFDPKIVKVFQKIWNRECGTSEIEHSKREKEPKREKKLVN